MKNVFRSFNLIVFGYGLLIIVLLVGCTPLQILFQSQKYVYEDGAVLVGGDNQPIELVNNAHAVDVDYSTLMGFIEEDTTDFHQYVARGTSGGATPFVCADYAEKVHNNAENAGIRAGYVGIDFTDGSLGHAVDIFETTDKGTVYIDCTGSSIYSQLEDDKSPQAASGWDKVGYVEIGKKYGVIGLDKAKSPTYAFFEEYDIHWQNYKDKLAAYNAEVKQYNQDIGGIVFREGSTELKRIQVREAQLKEKEKALDALRAELGNSRFKPLGIVKSTSVHW
jgi:hypothetical protein